MEWSTPDRPTASASSRGKCGQPAMRPAMFRGGERRVGKGRGRREKGMKRRSEGRDGKGEEEEKRKAAPMAQPGGLKLHASY